MVKRQLHTTNLQRQKSIMTRNISSSSSSSSSTSSSSSSSSPTTTKELDMKQQQQEPPPQPLPILQAPESLPPLNKGMLVELYDRYSFVSSHERKRVAEEFFQAILHQAFNPYVHVCVCMNECVCV